VLGVGFYDFAGSTVVHSIGGWLALAGALVIGPRIGKFAPDGTPKALPGHNLPFAVIGGFVLWLGWFGFNPGSTTTFDGNLARIAVMTNIAGAAGGIGAIAAIWAYMKKPDVGMTVNGFLAGMVAICTAVDVVTSPVPSSSAWSPASWSSSASFSSNGPSKSTTRSAASVSTAYAAHGALAYAFFGVEEFSMTVLFAQLIGIGVGFAWAFGTGWCSFWPSSTPSACGSPQWKKKKGSTSASMAEKPIRVSRSTICAVIACC
jgi:Amt family ammonium transporter